MIVKIGDKLDYMKYNFCNNFNCKEKTHLFSMKKNKIKINTKFINNLKKTNNNQICI